jgi:hypothetical protein
MKTYKIIIIESKQNVTYYHHHEICESELKFFQDLKQGNVKSFKDTYYRKVVIKEIKPIYYNVTYFEQYINDYGVLVDRIRTIKVGLDKLAFYENALNGLNLACGEYIRTLSITRV